MRRNRGKWKRPAVTGNWIQSSWLVQPVLCYWSWANNWTTTNWTYMYILLYNCFCFKESFKMLWGEMEESEKASVTGQSSWLVQPVLCHWATTTGQPLTLTILNTSVLHWWYWNVSVTHPITSKSGFVVVELRISVQLMELYAKWTVHNWSKVKF